jgi:N-carbamoylputrescine amidase
MALMGAEVLLYPTAIGSEPPPAVPVDSRAHWQRAQQGHAAANLVPVVTSNRIGIERSRQSPAERSISFYGHSFIADESGGLLAEAGSESAAVITATVDLAALQRRRRDWFVFRDRRPELYKSLGTLDGGDDLD